MACMGSATTRGPRVRRATASPDAHDDVAPFLAPYHLAQLALGILGAAGGGSTLLHLTTLAAFTGGFLFVARWACWRDEGRTYR
jgi:ABC-2 type transport system permease protein